MRNRPIVPCLWLSDRAEEAARFYVQTFPEGRIHAVARYPEAMDNPAHLPRGSVLTVSFEVAGQSFTALAGGPPAPLNPSLSFFVYLDAPGDVERLYGALAEGGEPLMALGSYPWSERYAWVKDRYGVSWQLMAGRRPEGGDRVVPCLMFSGERAGRAAEALEAYARAFPQGRVVALERYQQGEGPEGLVKHGRASLAGQALVAMDSHLAHDIGFTHGLSLQIMADTQAEIDALWSALGEGGAPGPCGWLTDRFGVSWQVVPSAMPRWMAGGDEAGRDRVFQAMLTMGKLDAGALARAFAG